MLIINNVRDIDPDRAAKKRTLSVLIGKTASLVLFSLLMLLPFAIILIFQLLYPVAVFTWFALLAAVPALVIAWAAKKPWEQILVLGLVNLTALLWAIGISFALFSF